MRLLKVIVGILAAIGIGALAACAMFMAGGIGARQPPGKLESAMAPRLRSMAIPRAARDMKSPVPASADAVKEGMEHFADHCAICHGNDGSGNTHVGQNMYPRVPDMRTDATQRLTDGELYYIIHNGVRWTGMPAWGEAANDNDQDSWKLVLFIRHLPNLSAEEIRDMERFNPKSDSEREEEKEEQEFLNGGPAGDATQKPR